MSDDKKFYETSAFKKINKEWRKRLKNDGFQDIEDASENLEQYDRRTIAFENRDRILEFFLKLDHYLTNTKGIPKKHRQILELYSAGTYIKGPNGIIEQTGLSDKQVRNIIKKYKTIIP